MGCEPSAAYDTLVCTSRRTNSNIRVGLEYSPPT